jgi:osmotically inducible lipoprotein OsmB
MHTTDTKSATQAVQFKKQGFKNQDFKKPSLIKTTAIGIALCLSLSSCGTMSNRGKSTAIGAGVGAVAGAVLTGGSAWGTVGGAAVGGVVGNQIGK